MRNLLVGLTGGIASGKSTVGRRLAEAGAHVVDADRLVAELHRPGGEGAAAVAALLGPEMLDERGGVDHPKVARRVFADPEARLALERAVHPLVRRRFEEVARATPSIVVLEAPLLVEAGYAPMFDLVVTVEADPEVRVTRAVARGLDEAQARARLAAQGEGEARRAAAHRIIRNEGDLNDLRRQVDALVADLRALAEAKEAKR